MLLKTKILELTKIVSLVIIFLSFIITPEAVYSGTRQGLTTWWQIIIPSLLPFFILSKFLIKMGVIHFLGTFLEPVMRPVFNIPGSGAFALIMGMTSGAPINGSIASQLRNLRILTIQEGERLIAFTSNSSLLFMASAIPIGMLNIPELGLVIVIIHYTSNIVLGIIQGQISHIKNIRSKNDKITSDRQLYTIKDLFSKARTTANEYLKTHYPGINKVCFQVVSESMNSILQIGGYIVLFSVLSNIMLELELNLLLFRLQKQYLPWFIQEQTLFTSLLTGLFETTVASELAATSSQQLHEILAVILLALGWGGLSIHAQIMTVISETDLGLINFFLTRLLHGKLSVIMLYCFNFIIPLENFALPVSQIEIVEYTFLQYWCILFLINCSLLLLLLIVSVMFLYVSSLKVDR